MKKLLIPAIALAIVACVASVSFAQSWTLSGNASAMSPNPNGAWTYGVYLEDSLNATLGPFHIWATGGEWPGDPSLSYYGNPGADLSAGAIFYTPTASDRLVASAGQWLLSGHVGMFSASYGSTYSPVIRWTAPSDMTVSIDSLFTGQQDGCNVGVHVLLNGDQTDTEWQTDPLFTGTHLLDGHIDGNFGCAALGVAQSGTSPSQAYTGTVSLLAGQYIDFVVDYGTDHVYDTDFTGLSATITAVPEPGSLSLVGCALVGLLAYAWKKRT
jgi:hypothetical protein